MAGLTEYDKVADARTHLKQVLDEAAQGTPVTVKRGDLERFAVVDAERLRATLSTLEVRPEIVSEDGGWVLFFRGLPLAAEGESLDELFADAVIVLREYAEDWINRLHVAPNHAQNWGLVQFVSLSNDAELRDWLKGS